MIINTVTSSFLTMESIVELDLVWSISRATFLH